MHDTAMQIGELFFKTYCKDSPSIKVVDIGSQDVNGSLRSVAPANCEYVGVDFQEGNGVDVVIDDPYALPLADDSADVVVCSSCFEHSEFFWLTFLEIQRILKPGGLLYLNVPSNGSYHTYPVIVGGSILILALLCRTGRSGTGIQPFWLNHLLQIDREISGTISWRFLQRATTGPPCLGS